MGALILGLVLIVSGVMMRPAGESIGWSFWWGLSGNSTAAGKAVFLTGSLILLGGLALIREAMW